MATRQDRIDWLLAHQSLWEGYPWGTSTVHGTRDYERERQIVEQMREAGVVSPKTKWQDVYLNNLIQSARKQRRQGAKPVCATR